MPDLFIAKKQKTEEKDPNYPSMDAYHSRSTLAPPPEGEDHKMNSMASYSEFPTNIAFENQEDDEMIYLFLRAHIITNLGWILLTVILLILPLLFITLVIPILGVVGITIPGNFMLVLTLFYYLIVFGYAFVNYVKWFFNIGLVTNLRVVDIDVSDITSKSVAATEMKDILDVEYSQKGFMQNFFDYGNIHIQLAGMKPNFEFLSIPRPAKTSDVITDLARGDNNAR
jgi:hypothetical protein